VHNPKDDLETLIERCQKYWDHEDFRYDAFIWYILRFLYQRGDSEYVGAYYRNQHVAQYLQRHSQCDRRYRLERNGTEVFNG